MSNIIRLPDPLPHPDCGADTPDGPPCQAPSTVTITTCLATDYAVIIWRCQAHAEDAITEAARLADHAMILVEPVDEAAGPDTRLAPWPMRPAGQTTAAPATPAWLTPPTPALAGPATLARAGNGGGDRPRVARVA